MGGEWHCKLPCAAQPIFRNPKQGEASQRLRRSFILYVFFSLSSFRGAYEGWQLCGEFCVRVWYAHFFTRNPESRSLNSYQMATEFNHYCMNLGWIWTNVMVTKVPELITNPLSSLNSNTLLLFYTDTHTSTSLYFTNWTLKTFFVLHLCQEDHLDTFWFGDHVFFPSLQWSVL